MSEKSDWDEMTAAAYYETDEPETETEAERVPSTTEPLVFVVIGSFAWTNSDAVLGALSQVWQEHGNAPVVVVTSGCPHGAEEWARYWAERYNQKTVTMRDEEMQTLSNAICFAFIKDESPGATAALENMKHRAWCRVYREETLRQVSAWASR